MPETRHEQVEITSRKSLRDWLSANYACEKSIWLIVWKKATGDRHVLYEDIVEEALCFGWIDSQPRKLDNKRSMLRLSPRNPTSAWSAINKQKIAKLTAAGLMHENGIRLVEVAKANGSWSRIDAAGLLEMPPDLAAALARYPHAEENFSRFPLSTRRAIFEWILQARTPETREKRLLETASLAEQNIRANQPRQPKPK